MVPAASPDRIEVISPWTEEVIASVPSGGQRDMDMALAAARRAFDTGGWPGTPLEERVAIVLRFRDLMVAHLEDHARLITDEMGCPITQAREIQVPAPVAVLEGYVQDALEYPFASVRRSDAGQS